MKKSVLVDFYNLDSQIKRLKETPKSSPSYPETLEELEEEWSGVKKTHIPMNEDERELLRFFENYVPHVVSKLTLEEIRQIITFFYHAPIGVALLHSDDEESFQKVIARITDEEFIQKVMAKIDVNSPLSYALILSFTTLEGYEVSKRISWFESDDFDRFAEEHKCIKLLIDKYLDDGYFTLADIDWLKSRMNRMGTYWMAEFAVQRARGNYKNLRKNTAEDKEVSIRQFRCLKSNNPFEFGILFGELFPLIYNEAMLMLKGELSDIDKCIICKKKLIKMNRSNRVYCSPECSQVPDSRKKSEAKDEIHQEFFELIDEWLGPKQESEWIDADKLAGDLSQEFSIVLVYQNDLDRKNISEGLRWQFKNNGISLSENANATIKREDSEWLIIDENKTYIVKKEKGKLNIIRKTFLLDKKSPSISIGTRFNKTEFEDKLKEKKKIIIDRRQKGKDPQEYKFIRI